MRASPARVLLDNQIFTSQVHGGVSRYFAELLTHRHALGIDIDLSIRLPLTMNAYLNLESGFTGLKISEPSNRHLASAVRRATRASGSMPPRGFRSFDLLHHTYYRPQVLRRTSGMLRATTLYDMIPELRPESFPSGNPHQAKKSYLESSDLIISISQRSADEMLELWPHLASRELAVVPLGVSDEFFANGPTYSSRRPYLLFVGSRNGYKDFGVVLEALASAGANLSELDLIAAGGGPFAPSEMDEISRAGLSRRVTQTRASDLELAALYRGAAAFVFPSIHEGFGLPTLEAMACQCPVILADTPVFREVAGNAAHFFEPRSSESLADSLGILGDHEALADLRRRGEALARRRSWHAMAEATGDAYRRVL